MIKLLKRMRRREALMALVCAVLVVAQVYFDLKLPDYMTRLTTLIKTPGSVTSDILSVGGQMLLCTLASAVLAVGCGYLAAKTASGFSFSVRADLFHHVMDAGSEEMQSFSVPSHHQNDQRYYPDSDDRRHGPADAHEGAHHGSVGRD